MNCIWDFLVSQENRITLTFIGFGISAVIGALWKYYVYLSNTVRSNFLLINIAHIAAVAVIVIVCGAGVYWLVYEIKLRCPDCKEYTIEITSPRNGASVPLSADASVTVEGFAQTNRVCRYVYIFVRNNSSGAQAATDLTEISSDGKWSGRADLRAVNLHVDRQVSGTVHARLVAQKRSLEAPPVEGQSSNHIELWTK